VQRLNQWVTTISVNKHVVGFATISVNDATIEPELASFERAVALGTALLVVPGDAAVIRDDVTSAWFTLTGTSLVALSAGTSGVATSTPIVTYQERLVAAPHTPAVDSEPNQGLIVGSITLGAAIGLVIVSLLVLSRRRAAADATLDATAPDAAAPEPVAEASPVTPTKPIIPAPVTAQTAAQKPTAVPPARARQGDVNVVRSKPVAVKRVAQSPVAPKPVAQSPVAPKTASKTTARGPRASKPAVTPEL
jgi:hypothetical protein